MSTQPTPILKVEKLETGYGAVQVLWGIDLEIYPGEMVALIGSNGAGKSTLLAALSGLLRPWSGRVTFFGEDVTGAPADEMVARGMIHVPQGRRLFAAMTVRENLLMGAYLRRDKEGIEADLERVLTLFPRLRERINHLAGKLSGGEQQMCALARGLMGRPRLLLVDELSLGLAPLLVEQIYEALAEINRQGTPVLLVEQDVQIALENASRAYVMETGRIVKAGPAKELMEDPEIQEAYMGV